MDRDALFAQGVKAAEDRWGDEGDDKTRDYDRVLAGVQAVLAAAGIEDSIMTISSAWHCPLAMCKPAEGPEKIGQEMDYWFLKLYMPRTDFLDMGSTFDGYYNAVYRLDRDLEPEADQFLRSEIKRAYNLRSNSKRFKELYEKHLARARTMIADTWRQERDQAVAKLQRMQTESAAALVKIRKTADCVLARAKDVEAMTGDPTLPGIVAARQVAEVLRAKAADHEVSEAGSVARTAAMEPRFGPEAQAVLAV